LASRWLGLVESCIGAERMEQGLEYARAGQVVSWSVQPGEIVADVQGRAGRPYQTKLLLDPWSVAHWDALIASMAGEAIHATRLMSGELPPALDELAAALGLELVPLSGAKLGFECTCAARDERGCKHAGAAAYLVAERLLTDPLLLLKFRGMTAEDLVERLRGARTVLTQGAAPAHGESMLGPRGRDVPPLEQSIENFWRCGEQLTELEQAPPPQHVSHALLRRLGPSTLKGKFPLVGLLASVYDEVSAAAIRMRDHAERLDEPEDAQDADGPGGMAPSGRAG
jgi:uncharacterized Zn finger protein